MAAKRNRKRSPINPTEAERNFIDLMASEKDDALTATALYRTSGTWRKILTYLRSPIDTPERKEAEAVLEKIDVTYSDGAFNSRTFFAGDKLLDRTS